MQKMDGLQALLLPRFPFLCIVDAKYIVNYVRIGLFHRELCIRHIYRPPKLQCYVFGIVVFAIADFVNKIAVVYLAEHFVFCH